MKLSILGATGFLGKVLLQKVLDEGCSVKTLVRDPEKLGELRNRVELIQGSIFDADKIEQVVEGADVVISTVGPPQKSPGNPESYKQAMENLVAAMEKNKVRKFIHVGGAVHPGGENENWTAGRQLLRLFLNLTWKPGLAAKQMEWNVLKESSINWTLVRPPMITNSASTGKVKADEKNLAGLKISVNDLSNFIFEQMSSETWIRKAPLVASAG